MRKIIVPMALAAALVTGVSASEASMQAQIDALTKQVTTLKTKTGGDNVKFSIDFRSAYDNVDYKIGSGYIPSFKYDMSDPINKPGLGMFTPVGGEKSEAKNDIWTNKLLIKMAAQPANNLIFKGAIGAYSTYGQNNMATNSMFQDFDWYTNEKPNDTSIKLKEAYFLYLGNMGIPYTASFGRRPSVDGFLVNYREDNEKPASPVGHNINMEFDGASFKFDFDELTGISGLYFKLCVGRGFSNTTGSYSMNNYGGFNPAYIDGEDNPDMDLVGILAQLYDNGQYKVIANYFQGYNMMGMGMDVDMTPTNSDPTLPTGAYTMTPNGFHDVGDLDGGVLALEVNGIGDEWSDFLDDTLFFVSVAYSKTKPNNVATNNITMMGAALTPAQIGGMPTHAQQAIGGMTGIGMLGSNDSETGYSVYVGINIPGFMEEDRFGFEYNKGSEYWRSFTYGEDTLAGSKLATRGSAYEVYYNLPLVGKNLTAQVRYTHMDYDYAGSDTFFGQTGNTDGMMGVMPSVESASNIRASLRYRY